MMKSCVCLSCTNYLSTGRSVRPTLERVHVPTRPLMSVHRARLIREKDTSIHWKIIDITIDLLLLLLLLLLLSSLSRLALFYFILFFLKKPINHLCFNSQNTKKIKLIFVVKHHIMFFPSKFIFASSSLIFFFY